WSVGGCELLSIQDVKKILAVSIAYWTREDVGGYL
ncbi:unnamed protein product, partial [marine sediment metagenome]